MNKDCGTITQIWIKNFVQLEPHRTWASSAFIRVFPHKCISGRLVYWSAKIDLFECHHVCFQRIRVQVSIIYHVF